MPAHAPACFNAIARLMPVVRAETARRLVNQGLPQDRVAEHLGVSQAMISKYLRRSPRPEDGASRALAARLVDATVSVALQEEQKGRIPPWCPVCSVLCDESLSCALEKMPDVDECLRHERVRAGGANQRVLADLREAEDRLRKTPFGKLVPEVRSNIARALPDAKAARDVAAFPGRLIELKGEIRGAAAPEFGSSSHLASVLLKVRRHQTRTHAILNARYDESVRRALRGANLRLLVLKRRQGDLAFTLPTDSAFDAVVDPGAFGVEPALYLLGETAVDVVHKAERILQQLNGA